MRSLKVDDARDLRVPLNKSAGHGGRVTQEVAMKRMISAATCCVVIAGCASTPTPDEAARAETLSPRAAASAPRSAVTPVREAAPEPVRTRVDEPRAATGSGLSDMREPFVSLGTGELMRRPQPRLPVQGEVGEALSKIQPVMLNLENGDLRELVRNIIVDTLGENVVLPPTFQGTVTIRTPKPIPAADLISVLETLLKAQNFSLVRDGKLWKVVPAAEAVAGNLVPKTRFREAQLGTNVVVYRARHVNARELERIMKPFARNPDQSIRVDELRNIIFLTGTDREVANLVEVADMFDVDLLTGMSFVIYPLQTADAKTVVKEFSDIFTGLTAGTTGAINPLLGVIRVVAIERMNAVLIISPDAEKIKEAQRVMERLDAGSDAGGGARLFVYNLQYGQAEKLQAVLSQALSGRSGTAQTSATVAPGQQQSNIAAPVSPIPGQQIVRPGNTVGQPSVNTNNVNNAANNLAAQQNRPGGPQAASQQLALARNATVIADKDRNALLIVATPSEYAAIEAAVRQLDVPPKQIAIEVRIAEVKLSDTLNLGVTSTFLGAPGADNARSSRIGTGVASSGGFSYIWPNLVMGGGSAAQIVKAELAALQQKNKIRNIASPVLVALDNQKVSFTNGTQISVQTQSSAGTNTTGIVNSFQYINTGLSINITPRVSGNNVFLEIQQQNSSTAPSSSGGTNPDISENSQQTTVLVPSGDTMMMAGLFVETDNISSSGVPFLSQIPVVGGLFGRQGRNGSTSEIVMLITPTILEDAESARLKVDELRKKMTSIEAQIPKVGTEAIPTRNPKSSPILDALNLRRADELSAPARTTPR